MPEQGDGWHVSLDGLEVWQEFRWPVLGSGPQSRLNPQKATLERWCLAEKDVGNQHKSMPVYAPRVKIRVGACGQPLSPNSRSGRLADRNLAGTSRHPTDWPRA